MAPFVKYIYNTGNISGISFVYLCNVMDKIATDHNMNVILVLFRIYNVISGDLVKNQGDILTLFPSK